MKRMLLYLLSVAVFTTSCELGAEHEGGDKSQTNLAPPITVEEAKSLYDTFVSGNLTRTTDNEIIPFDIGSPTLHWEEAEPSSNYMISSVDIPISDNLDYIIGRQNNDGEFYNVYTSAKLIVVKSSETTKTAVYARICIPDSEDDYYACNRSLSCNNRNDYCGLEYYMTVDGCPVAVAKFIDGKIVDGVFLGNENLSVETRVSKFVALMNNMWIRRYNVTTRGKNGFMDYGEPGDLFLDQFGNVLIYVDTDNDGKSDAVTDVRLLYSFNVAQGGSSTGYSGGGSSGSNSGGIGSGIGGSLGTGGSSTGGGGLRTGGSGSNNSTEGSGSGADNTNVPTFNGRGKRLDNLTVDPLKWDSWVSNGVVPSKPTEGEKEEKEEKPKADSLKCVADPLINMEILGTPVNGVKGGRFGNGRGRMHNGCDLKADVGTPVYAMFDGEITMVVDKFDGNVIWDDYKSKYGGSAGDRNAGNRIWLKCILNNGTSILIKYFHLNNITVSKGPITAGDAIGTTGQTGLACSNGSGGPHLHIEVWINDEPTDPEKFFFTQFDENGKPCNY